MPVVFYFRAAAAGMPRLSTHFVDVKRKGGLSPCLRGRPPLYVSGFRAGAGSIYLFNTGFPSFRCQTFVQFWLILVYCHIQQYKDEKGDCMGDTWEKDGENMGDYRVKSTQTEGKPESSFLSVSLRAILALLGQTRTRCPNCF